VVWEPPHRAVVRHTGRGVRGSVPSAIVDIDEMERGSVPRLLRLIFRDNYLEYAASRPELRLPKPLTVEADRRALARSAARRKVGCSVASKSGPPSIKRRRTSSASMDR